jgi:hypothetical protein
MDYVAFRKDEKFIIEKIENALGIKFQNVSQEKNFIYIGIYSHAFGDMIRRLRLILLGVIQDNIDIWA